MQSLKFYFKNPRKIISGFVFHLNFLFPDKLYLKIMFWADMGYKLNLNHPKTYSEKLQWLKLYDRQNKYSDLVDKILVKDFVANIVGEEYIIPTLAIWDNVDDVDIECLPEQFVLKANNGGGNNGVIICTDKSTFNLEIAKDKLRKAFKSSIYKTHREWPYKNVKPRVFAEKYMVENVEAELKDYKFFCFNGEVKALFIASGRNKGCHGTRFDYYDSNFNFLNFIQSYPNSDAPAINPPESFELMKDIATKLSKDFRHLRVDLYNINGHIYFGELTFYHYSGLQPFYPSKWDGILGEWLTL